MSWENVKQWFLWFSESSREFMHSNKSTMWIKQDLLVKAPNKFLVFDELFLRNQQSREGTTLAWSQEILIAGLIGFLLPFYPLASPLRGDSRWDPNREESFMSWKTQQTEESVEHWVEGFEFSLRGNTGLNDWNGGMLIWLNNFLNPPDLKINGYRKYLLSTKERKIRTKNSRLARALVTISRMSWRNQSETVKFLPVCNYVTINAL